MHLSVLRVHHPLPLFSCCCCCTLGCGGGAFQCCGSRLRSRNMRSIGIFYAVNRNNIISRSCLFLPSLGEASIELVFYSAPTIPLANDLDHHHLRITILYVAWPYHATRSQLQCREPFCFFFTMFCNLYLSPPQIHTIPRYRYVPICSYVDRHNYYQMFSIPGLIAVIVHTGKDRSLLRTHFKTLSPKLSLHFFRRHS